MLDTKLFGSKLKNLGFDFYSGVPCSFLKFLINYAINECNFVMAANEGDAVAVCAGAHMAGKKTILLCQNSGLANSINPLTSLNPIFKIPLLGFVSLRGEPDIGDQPQHEMMGTITADMLSLIDIKWEFLADNMEEAEKQLVRANKCIEENKSFFFIVKKGTFSEMSLREDAAETNITPYPKRIEALQIINKCKSKDTVVLATTGLTGRELYEIEDAPNNLYMVGSMGCVSSIGLGITLSSKKSVIAIDGDGALLMRLGSLTTNAAYCNKNLLHIVLDNNAHDSTGGQQTTSCGVDFVTMAAAAGYPCAIQAANLEEFEKHITEWKQNKKLTLLYLKTSKGKKEGLGRPQITPEQVKERLKKFIAEKNAHAE